MGEEAVHCPHATTMQLCGSQSQPTTQFLPTSCALHAWTAGSKITAFSASVYYMYVCKNKNIKNVTRCTGSRSAKTIETR